MRYGVVLIPIFLLVSGCGQVNEVECIRDSDCVPAGCSGSLCVGEDLAKNTITTCEYKEEYSCLEFTECGCVNNKCAWDENAEYSECLEEVDG